MSISVVPNCGVRDPRQLLYYFPSMPTVKYAKLVAEFHNKQMIELAENIAKNLGFLLVPSSCLHWEFRTKIPKERRVQTGKFSFYMLREDELTPTSLKKLREYAEQLDNASGEEVC